MELQAVAAEPEIPVDLVDHVRLIQRGGNDPAIYVPRHHIRADALKGNSRKDAKIAKL